MHVCTDTQLQLLQKANIRFESFPSIQLFKVFLLNCRNCSYQELIFIDPQSIARVSKYSRPVLQESKVHRIDGAQYQWSDKALDKDRSIQRAVVRRQKPSGYLSLCVSLQTDACFQFESLKQQSTNTFACVRWLPSTV